MQINYRTACIAAVIGHILLLLALAMEHRDPNYVVKPGRQTEIVAENSLDANKAPESIQAVSVDSQAVEETINQLRQERENKQKAEIEHQQSVQRQLAMAEQKRLQEQRNLEKLKKESARLAAAEQQKRLAEKAALQALEKQKMLQEKHLADLKQEAVHQQKLAALQQKLSAEQAHQAAQKAQAAAAQASAVKKTPEPGKLSAAMAGEVNKYKALIIQAISQHWILPDQVNHQLYSQFRIKLAPNGAVLSVSLTRSSGDSVLDRSAQAAIYKASPLPVPSDQATFNLFRDISLTVRPQSVRG